MLNSANLLGVQQMVFAAALLHARAPIGLTTCNPSLVMVSPWQCKASKCTTPFQSPARCWCCSGNRNVPRPDSTAEVSTSCSSSDVEFCITLLLPLSQHWNLRSHHVGCLHPHDFICIFGVVCSGNHPRASGTMQFVVLPQACKSRACR